MLKNHRVLVEGKGSKRAVMCYELGIIYQEYSPENVLAVYSEIKKGWILRKQPRYKLGSWGRPSIGDSEGYALIQNARTLLRSIDASFYDLSHEEFLNQKEIDDHNKKIEAINKLTKNLKLADLDELDKVSREIKIREAYHSNKENKKGLDVFRSIDLIESIVNDFLQGTLKKEKSLLGYTIKKDSILRDKKILAIKKGSELIVNSEVLRPSSFETNFLGEQTIIQKMLVPKATINIPFNVLLAADLKLNETSVIDRGIEETFNISGKSRHFTGALLLENHGRKFLMDVDRIEITHGIFNAFFVEVNSQVKTISEAYESMKPEEVKKAESEGIEVLRQGEWFFIKTDKVITVNHSNFYRWLTDDTKKAIENKENLVLNSQISHGKGRPNTVYSVYLNGEKTDLVTYKVDHTGREHKTLFLDKRLSALDTYSHSQDKDLTFTSALYKVVPNTTVSNFQITGDVD
ncbi:hypothetical protein EKK58_11150 [Candidatus Dependentiae bacterium]|nr:MAG: hypothetical protein EKK58_11150 [Candidatus Dependentiae bacterium]